MIFTLLILLHVCILTVDSMVISPLSEGSGIQKRDVYTLDMAPNTVDDMYNGCTEDMHKVVNNYLKEELNRKKFKNIWNGDECNTWATEKLKNDKGLTLDHFKALFVYTSKKADNNHFFYDFMKEVRAKGPEYPSGFSYNALHFFLSDAIRILKEKQPGCVITYRRTKDTYNVKVNDEIRFGFFASSSLDRGLAKYGAQDCFQINTCYGANLKSNEVYDQGEVLIPPYEVFKVTAVELENKNVLKCEKMYILEKTSKPVSNFNCKAVIKQ
ncbi:T-cell ecto-ADP-ribosyltransferase 2-like isoform X2 [Osmerus eperlanus]